MGEKGKLYTEAEVGAIIRRAVELQEQGQAQSYTPGVTDSELERIAKEMGISADYLRKAIVEQGGQNLNPDVVRLAFSKKVERIVDGELDPNDFDFIANELPSSGSPQMQPTQIGRTLKATLMSGVSTATINVTARNGRTRVEVNTKPILTTIFGAQAAFMGSVFGASLIGAQNNLVAGAILLSAGIVGGIGLFLGGLRSSNRTAENLANKIVKAVEDRLEDTQSDTVRNRIEETTPMASDTSEDSIGTVRQDS